MPTFKPRSATASSTHVRTRGARFLAAGLLLSGLIAGAVAATPASPASAAPGTPQAPSVVYAETFENGMGTAPVPLTSYTGASGETYSADPSWLTNCNGQIRGMSTPFTSLGNCANTGDTSPLGQLAYALGVQGGTNPNTNHAVAAYTENNPGANAVEFRTVNNIPLASSSGRFLTFSVDGAATNCFASSPIYQFAFVDAAGTATNVGGQLNVCASGKPIATPAYGTSPATTTTVVANTYTSNGSVLFTGSSLGIRMTNANGSGVGNDAAFDNIKVLDVTPSLDKAFSPTVVPTGGTSTLTFTVTNTSELAAKNGWSFTDALPAGLAVAANPGIATTCPAGVVTAPAGGTNVTVTGNLSVGMASCTVSVNVTSPTAGAAYTNGPSNVTTTGLNPPGSTTVNFESPALSLVKHAGTPVDVNGDGTTDVGDTIAYTFTVTNTGDVPLTAVGIDDPTIGLVDCPSSTLAPGADETCTAHDVYTVSAADVSAGAVVNHATAHGTPPSGVVTTSPDSSTSTPAVNPAPGLSVVKSATPSGASTFNPGQVITYHYVVTNTGNVPMNGIQVDEGAFTGTGTLSDVHPPCEQTVLAPGAQTTCTATYTLTNADVNSGSVSNTATVEGTPPGSSTPVVSSPSTVLVPTPEAPALTLTKTADPTTITDAGQHVTYSFLVTNTGNVSLSGVGIVEGPFNGTGAFSSAEPSCPLDTLLAGQAETCTIDYTVSQADVDAGAPIVNAATAHGTSPAGVDTPSPQATASLTVVRDPKISLLKTADVTAAAVGQKVTFSFLVTNTGNVTLDDPQVTETAFSGTGALSPIDCPPASLAPGDHLTCTATYTLTQADVDAGALSNTATATATGPAGTVAPVSDPSNVSITTSPAPAIAVVKTADISRVTGAGQTVTYSFTVTNTGNVTITDPVVREGAFTGHGTLSALSCPATTSPLAPAATFTCTATYTVVQEDLSRGGHLRNTASVVGTLPGGGTVTSDPSTADVITDPPAGLALTGSDLLRPGAAVAIVLLLTGALTLTIRRRRRDGTA